MYMTPNYILCKAEPGQNISHFAEEVIYQMNECCSRAIAVFNDVYIEIDETMTAKDIEREYLNAWEEM